MALTVGELNAVLSIDDRTVAPSLRRAEQAVREAGRRMGDDADRAGQEVGESLGDGVVRGVDGRLRTANGRFAAAGRGAGEAVGDGLTDAAADGASEAVEETGGRLDRLKMLAAGAGLAAGAALVAGLSQMMEQSQIAGRLGAQLGATPAEAERYGKIAGRMYANAVTADFQSAADAISATMRAGIAPPGATEAQLQSLSTKVSDLASTFELDLGQTANAVGQAIKTGLAKDGTEALDIFTRGMQVMGPRADDLMDTFNEYSTIFRQTGIDAKTATGLLSQGMKAGARDTDVIADSIKEFVLITQGGGDEVDKAFKKIGLSGKDMQKAFVQGGPAAKAALDQVFDRLRGMKDPTDRASVALTLFGTKAEDTQKALFSLDPSKAAAALGNVGGAADRMGTSLRDNAGANLAKFKATAQQALVDFLGGQAIPALISFGQWMRRNEGLVKTLAAVIGGALVIALTMMTINATNAAIAATRAWFATGTTAGAAAARHVAAAGTVVASWLRMAVAATAQGARIAAAAVASAATTAGAWVLSAARMTATWLVSMLRVAATTVAQFALMAARAIVWAATMAAQWLIAMGPVGWIIAAVIGLVALIIANWDKIKQFTAAAWDMIWQKIKSIGSFILNYILGWKLVSYFLSHWDKIKSGVATKASALLGWFKGLPGRLAGALGNLGSLLYDKGMDIVRGLWNGIKSMGGWLRDTLIGWARDLIPGPIAKALGIASPSKVMAKEVGRWIPAGVVQGIESGQSAVDSTMANLVKPPAGSAGGGGAYGATGAGARTRAGAPVLVEFKSSGTPRGDYLVDFMRSEIQKRGGDVQLVLGQRR
ncbi:phage tail tape measure protein [Streptomyces cinereoruber]|uniref:phage tail tape measure protein n=1 Tax=Streptomyces cinereoruber TaxID=67260 RepID=UPI00363F9AE6